MKRGGISSATAPASAAMVCIAALMAFGCSSSKNQYNPACGLLTAPDFDTDVNHCGGCDIVCEATGAISTCNQGQCEIADCSEGYFDVDGDPSNGCECWGKNPDACTLCLTYELDDNGRDDDCDGTADEAQPGETSDVIPLSRAHCGWPGASCLLSPGAEAVECALSWCSVEEFERDGCGHEDGHTICVPVPGTDRYDCGTCLPIYPGPDAPRKTVETYEQCFDGLDNDDSGVADDGPECEVLLANARTTACSGAEPSDACPPYHLTIPTSDERVPTLEVAFTYDLLVDRYEITRGQYFAYLDKRGFCDAERRTWVHPGCHVSASEAFEPMVDVTWCEAHFYCEARGKRLLTYAEYYRAALADQAEPGDTHDAQGWREDEPRGSAPRCDMVPAPVIERCGGTGAADVTTYGGDAMVGSRHRPPEWLFATAIRHLTGNVAEWMLDAYVDWCAAARAGNPHLALLRCPAEGEAGKASQRGPLVDLLVWNVGYDRFGPINGERLVMGGAYDGPSEMWRVDHRDHVMPASTASYRGFRCGRTLVPEGVIDPIREQMKANVAADCDWR